MALALCKAHLQMVYIVQVSRLSGDGMLERKREKALEPVILLHMLKRALGGRFL
jgi:hypothetical protein